MELFYVLGGFSALMIAFAMGISIESDYAKAEQKALKHCLMTINDTCNSAKCSTLDDKYKCQVIYSSMVDEKVVSNSLNLICDDKTCE
jgi:small basic protein